jgi:signal transduction histidine kinase
MTDIQQQNSESAYRAIFEGAPVAMWDEDFSGVRSLLDTYIAAGVENLADYLRTHPEAVRECVTRVHVRHVNKVAREFYGAESEEHLIASLPQLFDEAALITFREEVIAFVEGATAFESEFSVTTLSRERRRVVMNVSLLGTAANDWSEVVVTFTDITERRRLEQSLKTANESLRRLNQHLEQFAYAAAHDMREPLRTIALYAQLLQRQQPPAPGTRAEIALKYILDNGKRMETLVDDLLTFARVVEPPLAKPERYETDSRQVIDEALCSLSMAIQQASAQVHIDGDLPTVNMQPVHLRQIFQNLLGNAVKYRAQDEPSHIRVVGEAVDSEFRFCVEDNGIGISSDYHDRVFGIFKRLHGQEIEGNGIGLALCKKIVEDYGGRIWVESEPGKGSRFFFTIPAHGVSPD